MCSEPELDRRVPMQKPIEGKVRLKNYGEPKPITESRAASTELYPQHARASAHLCLIVHIIQFRKYMRYFVVQAVLDRQLCRG